MTDLEITRLCAEAMGYIGLKPLRELCPWMDTCAFYDPATVEDGQPTFVYSPIYDDAQAMALVKKFHLEIRMHIPPVWFVSSTTFDCWKDNKDLNRAICECVAKMQAAK